MDANMDEKFKQIFFEIHENLPRQGPGSFESTKRAFDILDLPPQPDILDVGCGPGKQTLDLLSLTDGHILAFDYYQSFLDQLCENAKAQELLDRIDTQQGDMNSLPFQPQRFDLIWSEGAIYIMGFANGLEKWRQFLKPNGYVAVSEITWLRPNPPSELVEFWQHEYPIKDIVTNLQTIGDSGYKSLGHFALPAGDWWDDYYTPIEKRLPIFRQKYQNDSQALQVVKMEEMEIEMHRKYSDYYGYVFYVMQK